MAVVFGGFLLVLSALVVGVVGLFTWLSVTNDIKGTVTSYYSALEGARYEDAAALVCRARASEAKVATRLRDDYGALEVETLSFDTRGGGPHNPWSTVGSGGVNIETASGRVVTRYVRVVKEDGRWRICPLATSLA